MHKVHLSLNRNHEILTRERRQTEENLNTMKNICMEGYLYGPEID